MAYGGIWQVASLATVDAVEAEREGAAWALPRAFAAVLAAVAGADVTVQAHLPCS